MNIQDKLLGASEVAEELGVSRQRVYQLQARYESFPEPVAQLARGALWSRIQIRQWRDVWQRKNGRPKAGQVNAP